MSEMVSNDVKDGMELLMTKLLPMVIEKLKNAEAKIAELETKVDALASKPKRTRTKKAAAAGECGPTGPVGTPDFENPTDTLPAAKPDTSKKKVYPVSDECVKKIHELYQQSLGIDFESIEVLVDADGTNLTVNSSLISTAVVDSIKTLFNDNPAATVQDVCLELKLPAIVVCFVMVMFGL